MRLLLELLTTERFRLSPQMYVGDDRFVTVASWLEGYQYALKRAFPDQQSDLDGFREWLQMKLEGSGNVPWTSLVSEKYGGTSEATKAMFELLDEFRRDIGSLGLDRILQDHLRYEMRRYGGPASSRLACRYQSRPRPFGTAPRSSEDSN